MLRQTTDPKTGLLHFDIEHALRLRVKKTEKARFVKFLRAYGEYVLLRAECPDLEAGLSDGCDQLGELLAAASALEPLTRLPRKQAGSSEPLLGIPPDLRELVEPCVDAVREDLKQVHQLLRRRAKVRDFAPVLSESGPGNSFSLLPVGNVQSDADTAELLRRHQHLFAKQQAPTRPAGQSSSMTKRPSLLKPAAKRRSH